MKISIINKWDTQGGAAKAAYRLFKSLEETMHDVNYYVNTKTVSHPKIHKLRFTKEIYKSKLDRLIELIYINNNRTNISNTFFSFSYHGINLQEHVSLLNSDIINLHWIEKLISNSVLEELVALNKPIVWTLHDMKPFTGGCHYNTGCRDFEKECFNCIQLENDPHKLPKKVLLQKLDILKNANLTIVSPSKWLASEAKKSSLFKDKKIVIIPNAIETDIYFPRKKDEAKKALQISPEKIVLQFGAQNANEKRKGFKYLLKAIDIALENKNFKKLCDNKKILILCLGHPSSEIKGLSIERKELGFITDNKQIALAYSATDLFILPTLEDNLPNTILESFACGTPIVGFDTGGVSDIVKNAENGILVPKKNTELLAKGIMELVFNRNRREEFGKKGRELILKKFTLENQATAYLKLFDDLLQLKVNRKTSNNKINSSDDNFDDIIGYCLKNVLIDDPNFIGNRAVNNGDGFVELKNCLNELCTYSIKRNPIKKIYAYKKVLKKFHEIK